MLQKTRQRAYKHFVNSFVFICLNMIFYHLIHIIVIMII